LVIHRHALADETLGAGEALAALVGEKLADGADAAGTEVVDIVDDALAALEADEILGGLDDVLGGDDALLDGGLEVQLLVDLVAADRAEVVALRVEEQALEEGLGVGDRGGLARAEALVDFLEGLLLVDGRVLLEGADDRAVVGGGVEDLDGGDVVLLESADGLLGDLLERASENDALVRVDHVVHEDERGNVLHVEELGDLDVLDLVEELEDLDVVGVTERAEKRRDKELTAAATTIEINVEEVVLVELDLEPGAAVGDDAEGEKLLAGGVAILLEAEAGRAV